MKVGKYFISILLVVFILKAFPQDKDQYVSGTLNDVNTGDPIPFVSVGTINTTLGTSTNIEGEFLLKIDSFPIRIVLAHLNYQKRLIEIKHSGNIGEVQLIPVENTLDEVTISEKKKGNPGFNLLLKAYEKAVSITNKEYYGKAFYRQKTKQNEDDFYELYEIFYDAKFSSRGITDWAIQEGRYALKDEPGSSYLYNRNFTLFGRVLSMFQPNTDDYIMPVNPEVEQLYDVSIEKLLKIGDREVAVVNCQILKDVKTPSLNGKVYVDIKTYDILKLEGKITHDDLALVKLTQKGAWVNYELEYEIAYKTDKDSILLLDYIRIGQSFDYSSDNALPKQTVKTDALLTFYDYYQPASKKRLGGRIRDQERDADILNKIGYNQAFWMDNPIVKRTPVEENVIKSFESSKAFGTIYLNERELVELEKDNLEDNPIILDLISKLRSSGIVLDQEKVYLHFDKDFYTAGEKMWFKGYLLEAILHKPIKIPSLLFVELYDTEMNLMDTREVKIEDGWGNGEFILPVDIKSGNYLIRAYTSWMRNFPQDFFFSKLITIYNSANPTNSFENQPPLEKIDLQFFPEGGDLIGGIITQVGFKAIGPSGNGIKVSGKIINSKNEAVTSFNSNYLGMGSFYIMPAFDDQLSAVINHDNIQVKYDLPKTKSSGISISVRYLNSKTIKVALRASPDFEGKKFYLLGQSKGIVYHKEGGVIQKGQAILNIPESKFPQGILQLTLFDESGKPLLERLVFMMTEPANQIHLKLEDSKLTPRQKVNVDLAVTNLYGRAMKSELSIAVTDFGQLSKDIYGDNISNYLLLKSELKGRIEDPGYYFKDQEKQTLQDLDILMLTQGWRRFKWDDLINNKKMSIQFFRGHGFITSGTILSESTGMPLGNHTVTILSDNFFQTFKTDELGNFSFVNQVISDNTKITASILNSVGNPVAAKIIFNEREIPPMMDSTYQKTPFIVDKGKMEYMKEDQIREQIEAAYGDKVYMLSEVTLEDDKIPVTKDAYENKLYREPDASIEINDANRNYSNIMQVLSGRVAGLRVTPDGIRIRGAMGDPLILVNGSAINPYRGQTLESTSFGINSSITQAEVAASNAADASNDLAVVGSSGTNLVSQLSMIDVTDIERIDIITSATAMYGLKGSNGVIAIYTRRSIDATDKAGKAKSITMHGFDPPREFYEPKYEHSDADAVKPDHRATLSWQPHIRTDTNGKAQFSFYNSDKAQNLEIVVEGITEEGSPVNLIYRTTP